MKIAREIEWRGGIDGYLVLGEAKREIRSGHEFVDYLCSHEATFDIDLSLLLVATLANPGLDDFGQLGHAGSSLLEMADWRSAPGDPRAVALMAMRRSEIQRWIGLCAARPTPALPGARPAAGAGGS